MPQRSQLANAGGGGGGFGFGLGFGFGSSICWRSAFASMSKSFGFFASRPEVRTPPSSQSSAAYTGGGASGSGGARPSFRLSETSEKILEPDPGSTRHMSPRGAPFAPFFSRVV